MKFSDNLRQLRKEKGLSQENLAELLEVSRQAVSKWEQGEGYPEVEKLLLLSRKLNISLDDILDTGFKRNNGEYKNVSGEILVSSPNENTIMKCTKVTSSQEFRSGKHSPRFALYGLNMTPSLSGESSTFLGWYADKESISKEISEIQLAMFAGTPSYELKYSVKAETRWGRVKIIE